MKITDVKVFPVDEEKLKAYATITFENCFIVRDLKVISGNKGYFIAMPSKKRKDGTFRDVAHPLNSETRKMIEEAVLEVYEREVVAMGTAPPSADTEPAVGEESEAAEPVPVSEEDSDQEAPAEEGSGEEKPLEEESTEPPPETEEADDDESPDADNPPDEDSDVSTEDPEKAFGYEE